MEKRFIAQEGMDFTPGDLNAIQSFAEVTFDHLGLDALGGRARFAGFATAQTGNAATQTAIGRLFTGGKIYPRDTVFAHDFTALLPVATRKICTIYCYADQADGAAVEREFLIDVENETTEPRAVSVERHRVARLQVAQGVEGPNPAAPPLGEGALAIAHVTLTVLGIESVAMIAANRLTSVDDLLTRVVANEEFRGAIGSQVKSISSDIAALADGQKARVTNEQYARTLSRVAYLEARIDVPEQAVDSYTDLLLDEEGSDPAFAGYDAQVVEGIRFPEAAATVQQLALQNPLDAAAHLTPNGALLPAFDRELRFSNGKVTGEQQLNAYTYQNHDLVKKEAGRLRLRHGPFLRLASTYGFLKAGKVDLLSTVFAREGENYLFDAELRDRLERRHVLLRRPFFWLDKVEEPYWEQVTTEVQVPGYQVAETFLQGNDMWLSAIGLTFTKLAAAGSVDVAICECVDGRPDPAAVIARTTVDHADLTTEGETLVAFQPTFLQGGKRYGIVILTAAAHFIGTVEGDKFPNGTFFYWLDGQYQQGDATKDIALTLYACRFRAARSEIRLGDVLLAGGIADLDLLTEAIEPGATRLALQVQVAGIWRTLGEGDTPITPGGNAENLLPLRVVFSGTADVQPMLQLTGSQLRASRPKPALTWISAIRELPGAGSSDIVATFRLENYAEADHDFTVTLLHGAGFATVTAATSVTDTMEEDGAILRTVVFTLGADITEFRLKAVGALTSVLAPFHVATRRDYAT